LRKYGAVGLKNIVTTSIHRRSVGRNLRNFDSNQRAGSFSC